jgi:hypothetical protein
VRWIYVNAQQPSPLKAISFLVEGGHLNLNDRDALNYFPNRAMSQKIEWVMGLFERLENERIGRRPVELSE